MKEIKRLSDAELEIMLVLWGENAPVSSGHIRDHLKGKRDWALSTLMTVLERLVDKQFIHCDRSTRTNLYSTLCSEDEYKTREGKTFLGKLYGSSLTNLVLSLHKGNAISDQELNDLSALLKKLEEERI